MTDEAAALAMNFLITGVIAYHMSHSHGDVVEILPLISGFWGTFPNQSTIIFGKNNVR